MREPKHGVVHSVLCGDRVGTCAEGGNSSERVKIGVKRIVVCRPKNAGSYVLWATVSRFDRMDAGSTRVS